MGRHAGRQSDLGGDVAGRLELPGGVLDGTDDEGADDGVGPTIDFQASVSRSAPFEARIRCTQVSAMTFCSPATLG